nr:hypothetical protein [Tanacetum cinerariifolium]
MIDQALLQNSTNRDESHSSDEDNQRNVQTACPCFSADFMKCQPLNFKGTEGVVALTRWIEKMESVFPITGCAIENQVKFATCTLRTCGMGTEYLHPLYAVASKKRQAAPVGWVGWRSCTGRFPSWKTARYSRRGRFPSGQTARVDELDIDRDPLSGDGLEIYLHTSSRNRPKIEDEILSDVVVGKGTTMVLKQNSSKKEPLVKRGNTYMLTDEGLHMIDGATM